MHKRECLALMHALVPCDTHGLRVFVNIFYRRELRSFCSFQNILGKLVLRREGYSFLSGGLACV